MQEIKKRRILLASVLKPVDDPRMYEKIGQSLAQKYEVHLLGQRGHTESSPGVFLHPLSPFARLSVARFFAPLRILREIRLLKPGLLIICTHELLFLALAAKILTRCKVIYDVQENYWQNIYHGKAFPVYLKLFVASYVRFKEWIISPVVDYYFLAESCYQDELGFTKNKRIVLENKLKRPKVILLPKKGPVDKKIHLLFTGTIAETTGIFIAIKVAASLFQLDPGIRLLIIGYCPLHKTLDQVRREIADKPFITLTGGNDLIPHEQILSAIQAADFGIIAYPPNPSTANAIPTKLYEYLGCQLPILLINHPPWTQRCKPYPAAIPFDAERMDARLILEAIRTRSFYTTLPEDVYWDTEEKKLNMVMETIMP